MTPLRIQLDTRVRERASVIQEHSAAHTHRRTHATHAKGPPPTTTTAMAGPRRLLAVLSACAAAAVAHSRSSPECVEAPDRTWDLQLQLGCGKGVGVKCYTVLQGSDLAKNEGKGIFELNDVAVPGVYTLAVEVGGNVKKASISPDKTNIEFTLAPLEPGGQNEQIPYVPASWPRHNMPARDIVHCQHAPFALPCAMGGGEEGGGEREGESERGEACPAPRLQDRDRCPPCDHRFGRATCLLSGSPCTHARFACKACVCLAPDSVTGTRTCMRQVLVRWCRGLRDLRPADQHGHQRRTPGQRAHRDVQLCQRTRRCVASAAAPPNEHTRLCPC